MSELIKDEAKELQENTAPSAEEIQSYIARVEDQLSRQPQLDLVLNHHFSKDVYARELHIPKGTIAVGKIHKHQNLNILSKGEISIFSIDGVQRVKAPFTVVSSPGVKRLVYAHEDCIWTTIHGTSETDLEKIEEQFIAKDYSEVVQLENKEAKCLGQQ